MEKFGLSARIPDIVGTRKWIWRKKWNSGHSTSKCCTVILILHSEQTNGASWGEDIKWPCENLVWPIRSLVKITSVCLVFWEVDDQVEVIGLTVRNLFVNGWDSHWVCQFWKISGLIDFNQSDTGSLLLKTSREHASFAAWSARSMP